MKPMRKAAAKLGCLGFDDRQRVFETANRGQRRDVFTPFPPIGYRVRKACMAAQSAEADAGDHGAPFDDFHEGLAGVVFCHFVTVARDASHLQAEKNDAPCEYVLDSLCVSYILRAGKEDRK